MSSLRNAVKRITHKERSQPQSRSHLGLLEKKGDYRQRSRDYHRKQDRLKSMRDKIANKNPDEFYFGMHSSRVDNYGLRKGGSSGRHVKTDEARQKELEEKGLGADAVRIMKDQDLAYVRMQRVMDGKKVERLQSSLHYLEGNHRQYNRDDNDGHVDNSEDDEEESGALLKMVAKKRKHTVFVDGGQSAVDNFDAARHFDTIPELVGRSFNRPHVKELEREAMRRLGGKVAVRDADDDYYDDDEDEDDNFDEEGNPKQVQLTEKQLVKQERNQMKLEKRIAKSRSAAYSEMELRNERMKKLQNAEAHLIVEKQTRMKGRKRKIAGKEDGKPAVYKWRRKRAK